MVASVQDLDVTHIRKSQQADRFSTHMRGYLSDGVLPSDELEILAVMLAAPFCVIEENTLVRITQGKRLAPKPGETTVTYSPPLKKDLCASRH